MTGSVLTFIGAFGTFSIPLVMGRGQDVLSVVAYRAASSFDWGSAATIVVIMAVVQLGVLAMYALLPAADVAVRWLRALGDVTAGAFIAILALFILGPFVVQQLVM